MIHNAYQQLAINLIGQCEVGNVDVIVFVKNGAERAKLIDTIAYYQHVMDFEGFTKNGTNLRLFGKNINIIILKPGAVNRMKYGNKRVYSLDT